MGEIHPGDEVIGSDGRSTVVLGVYPQGIRELARVTFNDGCWVDCDWDHLWTVINPSTKQRGGHWRTYTTRELARGVNSDRWGNKTFSDGGVRSVSGNPRYQIPLVESVVFAPNTLPLDPYRLGVILGDGTVRDDGGVQFSTDRELLPDPDQGSLRGGCWYQSTTRYRETLFDLGLVGKRASDKFIPPPYLVASPQDRLALLQGLMDTDGYPIPDGGAEFCSTSLSLVDGVVDIVQSLGGIARGRRQASSIYTYRGERRQGKRADRVNIKLPAGMKPFRLTRKSDLYVEPTKYPPCRSIVSIEPTIPDEAVCIRVAAEDQLYVIKDYIVTHNTVLTIAAAEELIERGDVGGGLIIVPASLKYQWAQKIDEFTDGANVLVVDGDAKDRMRSYHRIKEGKVEYAILNYEQVVNDWKLVKSLPRDFICIDECTAIKNPGTQRSRKLRSLKAHYKWGLTGQPVENRAEEVFHIMSWIDPTVLGPANLFDQTFIVRDSWGNVQRYRNLPLLHKALSRRMVRKTLDDPEVRDQMPRVTEESILVPFDRAGSVLYKRVAAELLDVLENSSLTGSWNVMDHYSGSTDRHAAEAGDIMSRITCLRMLCDHPELLRLSARMRRGEATEEDMEWGGSATGSAYAAELDARGLLDPLKTGPKLAATLDVVDDILLADPRNKVVVFSFFKGMLSILQKELGTKTGIAMFHGGISTKQREVEKQRFLSDPSCRVFLSSDAGGVGVDLPVANYLISVDLPWSAGAWRQRNARIIRLSSEWNKITLISMLMAGSIEERQYDALQMKQKVADAITDGRGADIKGDLRINLDSLTEFLRTSSLKLA